MGQSLLAASNPAGMKAVAPNAPVVDRRAAGTSAATRGVRHAMKAVPQAVASFAVNSAARAGRKDAAKAAGRAIATPHPALDRVLESAASVNAVFQSAGRAVAPSAASPAAPLGLAPAATVPSPGASPSAPVLCGSAALIAAVSAPPAVPC